MFRLSLIVDSSWNGERYFKNVYDGMSLFYKFNDKIPRSGVPDLNPKNSLSRLETKHEQE